MQPLLLVMAGGAVGSAARYLTGRAMGAWLGPDYPWGTLTVNLAGGFLMGLLVGVLARNNVGEGAGEGWRLLLGVGLLGGFTTFSAFALDAVALIERGATASAALYVIASVVGAMIALFAGLSLVRAVA